MRVSLHRMFLDAPRNIMDELACYLRREVPGVTPSIKRFIDNNLRRMDYSAQLNPNKLYSVGNVYNLNEIYREINEEYFDGRLDLKITWFGKIYQRGRTRAVLGLYQDNLKLIKIHRRLDSHAVPEYLVRFIVYHEMLHHVCPARYGENGKYQIHTKEFKRREAQFVHYRLAKQWIKDHEALLFH